MKDIDKMIAFCGITCTECPAFLATQKDEDNARIEVAELWSKEYNADVKPKDINCDGCLSENGRLFSHCKVCEIRNCAKSKDIVNCAHCIDYACKKVKSVIDIEPDAKLTLEKIRDELGFRK